jgi:hypothetical protein
MPELIEQKYFKQTCPSSSRPAASARKEFKAKHVIGTSRASSSRSSRTRSRWRRFRPRARSPSTRRRRSRSVTRLRRSRTFLRNPPSPSPPLPLLHAVDPQRHDSPQINSIVRRDPGRRGAGTGRKLAENVRGCPRASEAVRAVRWKPAGERPPASPQSTSTTGAAHCRCSDSSLQLPTFSPATLHPFRQSLQPCSSSLLIGKPE